MLSSFFKKSKPINFIVIALYLLLLYVWAYVRNGISLDYRSILLFMGGAVIYILSMFLINNTTQTNDLTQKSTYTIVLFAFLTAVIPSALVRTDILFANFLLILALKNSINLRNYKNIKSKIFNASLCIGLASVAYFWSIAFIIVVYIGIFYFEPKNYRNWCIPIVGLLTIFILANFFTLLFLDSFFLAEGYIDNLSFSFEKYLNKSQLFSLGTLLLFFLFFFSIYIAKFKRKSSKSKPVLKLIIAQLLVAIGMVFLVPDKNAAEMIFIATPLAIIGTTYLELDHNKLVKEINIWIFLMLPFIAVFL